MISRMVYAGELVRIGEFRCPPEVSAWREPNVIGPYYHVVFPRTLVEIRHDGRPPVVGTPNHVMFYNPNQRYHRGLISPVGDHCEWFHVRGDLVCDAVQHYDPAAAERPDAMFTFERGPGPGAAYLRQRALYHRARRGALSDDEAGEAFIDVLSAVVAAAYGVRGRRSVQRPDAGAQRRCARSVLGFLADAFARRVTLDDVAAATGYSVFHLCRTFRAQTGFPVHRFVNRLRLRHALERLPERGVRMLDIALDLGFSSESHFSAAFRREYGLTARRARDLLRGGGTSLR